VIIAVSVHCALSPIFSHSSVQPERKLKRGGGIDVDGDQACVGGTTGMSFEAEVAVMATLERSYNLILKRQPLSKRYHERYHEY